VLPVSADDWYPFISNLALLMVGFLLGGKLSLANLRRIGGLVLGISVFEVVGVALLVAGGLWLLGAPLAMALTLGGIAPASAPAAVSNVVSELRSSGRFTDTLLGIVAIDDAWGVVAFSLLLASAQAVLGEAGSGMHMVGRGLWEIAGALGLGLAVGLPAAALTGRLKPGEPTQAEALGVVLLAGGLALALEVSHLLTAVTVGAVIVNLASHHDRPFHEIEHIEWPFMVLFFLLAGASLHVGQLGDLGLIGIGYVLFRLLGLVGGAYTGGRVVGAPAAVRRWMGAAILPQAGVALGMALVASHALPGMGEAILSLVVATTVIFELVGPALTRLAILRAGEGPANGRN
jgi:Kef-type K+ transport system membrane component KefB